MIRLSPVKQKKYNKNNKANTANKANDTIKVYNDAMPKNTKALWYNDTTGIYLKFYLKMFSDLQKTNE